MSYQIFVEQQPHNGYRAMALGLPDCIAEGHSEIERRGLEREMALMAADPQIQAELRAIEQEFAVTENDGLSHEMR